MNKHLAEFFKQQAVIDLNQIVFMLLKGTTQQRTQRFFLRLLALSATNKSYSCSSASVSGL